MPQLVFFIVFAFIAASFVLWRLLKDDYPEEEIITFTILFTFFALLSGRVFYIADHFSAFDFQFSKWLFWYRFPGFSLAGAFWGGALFSFWRAKKKDWDAWLLADAVIRALVWAVLLGGVGFYLVAMENSSLFKLVWALIVFLLSFIIIRRYRKFVWYKSGKPGFIACFTTALYFLGLFVLDFSQGSQLYFNLGGSISLVTLALVFLYLRSDRKLKEDLAGLIRFPK